MVAIFCAIARKRSAAGERDPTARDALARNDVKNTSGADDYLPYHAPVDSKEVPAGWKL